MSEERVAVKRGNYADAHAGKLSIPVGELLQRSWEITARSLPVMLPVAVVIFILSSLFSGWLEGYFPPGGPDPESMNIRNALINMQVPQIMLSPLFAILTLMGIRNANDEKLSFSMITETLQRAPQVVLATVVEYFLLIVVVLMTVLALSWLNIAFAVSMAFIAAVISMILLRLMVPLIVHRKFGVGRAFLGSVLVVKNYLWPILGLLILMYIILFISALPFLIGLIFTFPMLNNLVGVIYIALYGDNQQPQELRADEQLEQD